MAEAAPRVEGVEAAATALTSGVFDLLIDLKCEIVEAQVYKFMRQSEDQRNEAVMRTNALVLNDVDFAGHERRLALLDEEFDRLLHRRFVGPQIRERTHHPRSDQGIVETLLLSLWSRLSPTYFSPWSMAFMNIPHHLMRRLTWAFAQVSLL